MNNGPWSTGFPQGYTAWSAKNGQVTFDPQSSFNPMTYQQKYSPAASQPAMTAPLNIDWASLLGQQGNNSRGTPHIQTSITAGPVYNPGQVNGALAHYGNFGQGLTGSAANLYGQEAQRGRVLADRSMASTNAQHSLTSQKARSDAGLRWGSVASQQNQLADAQQGGDQQFAMTLLRALMG